MPQHTGVRGAASSAFPRPGFRGKSLLQGLPTGENVPAVSAGLSCLRPHDAGHLVPTLTQDCGSRDPRGRLCGRGVSEGVLSVSSLGCASTGPDAL